MRKKQARIAQRITALVAAAVMSVGLFTGRCFSIGSRL